MKIIYLSGYGLACGGMPGMSGRLLAGQWHVMRTYMYTQSVFRTVGTEFSNIWFVLIVLAAGHWIRFKLLRQVQNQQREEKTDNVILTYPSPSVCGVRVSKMDEGTGCMIISFGHQCFFTVIRMYIHFIFVQTIYWKSCDTVSCKAYVCIQLPWLDSILR